ncbi:MAG: glycerol-3-phosphate 1-O-acyltransferase PlsY [Anaerolineaceae bacterium]|nr:glycerol-3-phosphate 1-O-acyltransferase PlsY [Anaerolineaceae bacterium]
MTPEATIGFVIYCLAAYLLGSLPFGFLVGRLAGRDIREAGSRNIGATNCWRVCGWKYGLAAFLLDVAKGFAPTLAAYLMTRYCGLYDQSALSEAARYWLIVIAGSSAIVGHVFPVFLGFRGGKAVATSLGVLLGLPAAMPLAVGAFAVWAVVFALTRYVSVASTVAALALMAGALTLDARGLKFEFDTSGPWAARLPVTVMILLLVALVLLRHRANYKRLLASTENKFGGRAR